MSRITIDQSELDQLRRRVATLEGAVHQLHDQMTRLKPVRHHAPHSVRRAVGYTPRDYPPR